MSLEEIINDVHNRILTHNENEGDWNGEELKELLLPLHHALLNLTCKSLQTISTPPT